MTSRNKLLGNITPLNLGMDEAEEAEEVKEVKEVKEANTFATFSALTVPILMYSKTCREGKVFIIQKELDALGSEWFDHPGKVFLLPGFEYLYQGV